MRPDEDRSVRLIRWGLDTARLAAGGQAKPKKRLVAE